MGLAGAARMKREWEWVRVLVWRWQLQKDRRRSGAIISNCCAPTRHQRSGSGVWHGGGWIWMRMPPPPLIPLLASDTCGILRLMPGGWRGAGGVHSFIWHPTRPHNYRHRRHRPYRIWIRLCFDALTWHAENSLPWLELSKRTLEELHTNCGELSFVKSKF